MSHSLILELNSQHSFFGGHPNRGAIGDSIESDSTSQFSERQVVVVLKVIDES